MGARSGVLRLSEGWLRRNGSDLLGFLEVSGAAINVLGRQGWQGRSRWDVLGGSLPSSCSSWQHHWERESAV